MPHSLKLKPNASISVIPVIAKGLNWVTVLLLQSVHMSLYSFGPAVVKTGITHGHTHRVHTYSIYTGTVARRDIVRFSVRPRNRVPVRAGGGATCNNSLVQITTTHKERHLDGAEVRQINLSHTS